MSRHARGAELPFGLSNAADAQQLEGAHLFSEQVSLGLVLVCVPAEARVLLQADCERIDWGGVEQLRAEGASMSRWRKRRAGMVGEFQVAATDLRAADNPTALMPARLGVVDEVKEPAELLLNGSVRPGLNHSFDVLRRRSGPFKARGRQLDSDICSTHSEHGRHVSVRCTYEHCGEAHAEREP